MYYSSEHKMSKDFEAYLRSQVGSSFYKEWPGLFGIPDYVYFEKGKRSEDIKVVSFELKLTNWRKAMIQAFRYKSFSDMVYVVMPEDTISRAMIHSDEFELYGIGLASFSSGHLCVLINAVPREPYSHDLRKKVIKRVNKSRGKRVGMLHIF